MDIHELHHFSSSDRIGRIGENLHDTRIRPMSTIIWKAREYRKSPDENACLVTEHGIRGITTTPTIRRIDDIIV